MARGTDPYTLEPRHGWLLAILIAGALPRLLALDFGFPGLFRPDEELVLGPALRFHSGDLNPHQFDYPTLYLYVVSLLLLLVRVAWDTLALAGTSFEALTRLHHGAPPYLVGRALTAILGVAGLHAVYRLGRTAAGSRVGLLAAGMLAVNYIHLRDSHFATTDVPLTLVMTHALVAQLQVVRRGRLRDYCWAGLLAGLAGSVKYTGLGLCVSLLLAHAIRRTGRTGSFSPASLGRPLLALSLVAVAFLLTSPYVLLDFSTASQRLDLRPPFVPVLQVRGAPPPQDLSGWGWLLGRGLWYGAGPAVEALWLLALSWATWRLLRHGVQRCATWLLLIGYQIALTVPLVLSPWAFVRYVMPLLPVTMVLVSAFVLVCVRRFVSGRRATLVAALLLAGASLDPAVRAARTVQMMRLPDTRHAARLWIGSFVPPGSALFAHPAHGFNRPVLPHGYRYENLLDVQRVSAEWVLLEQAPVACFTPEVPEELLLWIRAHGELAARFDPYAPSSRHAPVYDPQDAFYVPLAGHGAVRAPGPLLEIYRLPPT
jgi:hypothetical protein